jgi:hypothetical protein
VFLLLLSRIILLPSSLAMSVNNVVRPIKASKLDKRELSDQQMPCVNMPRVNIFPPNKRYKPTGD